jgi:hypothetical protein
MRSSSGFAALLLGFAASACFGVSTEDRDGDDSDVGEAGSTSAGATGGASTGGSAGSSAGKGGTSAGKGGKGGSGGSSGGSAGSPIGGAGAGGAAGSASGSGGTDAGGVSGTAGSGAGLGGAGGSGAGAGGAGAGGAGAGGVSGGGPGGTGGVMLDPDPGPPVTGSCAAPCEIVLEEHAGLPSEGAKGAVLVYDFETGESELTSDVGVYDAHEWVLSFTLENNQYGYGVWASSFWFVWVDPYEYDEGGYSLLQDLQMTAQLVNTQTDQSLMVVFSLGEETARVHAVWEPNCNWATSGACASPGDCSLVHGGTLRPAAEACASECVAASGTTCVSSCIASGQGLSPGCSDCYSDYIECVSSSCSADCPGQGGNVCMSCEVDNCRTAFMTCSGLDHIPANILTLPL